MSQSNRRLHWRDRFVSMGVATAIAAGALPLSTLSAHASGVDTAQCASAVRSLIASAPIRSIPIAAAGSLPIDLSPVNAACGQEPNLLVEAALVEATKNFADAQRFAPTGASQAGLDNLAAWQTASANASSFVAASVGANDPCQDWLTSHPQACAALMASSLPLMGPNLAICGNCLIDYVNHLLLTVVGGFSVDPSGIEATVIDTAFLAVSLATEAATWATTTEIPQQFAGVGTQGFLVSGVNCTPSWIPLVPPDCVITGSGTLTKTSESNYLVTIFAHDTTTWNFYWHYGFLVGVYVLTANYYLGVSTTTGVPDSWRLHSHFWSSSATATVGLNTANAGGSLGWSGGPGTIDHDQAAPVFQWSPVGAFTGVWLSGFGSETTGEATYQGRDGPVTVGTTAVNDCYSQGFLHGWQCTGQWIAST